MIKMKFEVNVIDCTQLIQAMTKNSNERRAELETAMEIVKFMDQHNIELDNTAYICLLTACSNVGSIEESDRFFQASLIRNKMSMKL